MQAFNYAYLGATQDEISYTANKGRSMVIKIKKKHEIEIRKKKQTKKKLIKK